MRFSRSAIHPVDKLLKAQDLDLGVHAFRDFAGRKGSRSVSGSASSLCAGSEILQQPNVAAGSNYCPQLSLTCFMLVTFRSA